MPRRRFARRRPRRVVRRPVRRVMRRMPRRVPRAPRSSTIMVKERFLFAGPVLTGNTGYAPGLTLNMIDATQLAAYVTLYNNYRILGARFQFVPFYSGQENNQAYLNLSIPEPIVGVGRFIYNIETKDASIPVDEPSMLTENTAKITTLINRRGPLNIFVRHPCFQIQSQSGAGQSFVNRSIDTGHTAVPHYALKWFCTEPVTAAGGDGGDFQYSCYIQLYLMFSDPK